MQQQNSVGGFIWAPRKSSGASVQPTLTLKLLKFAPEPTRLLLRAFDKVTGQRDQVDCAERSSLFLIDSHPPEKNRLQESPRQVIASGEIMPLESFPR